MAERGGNRGFDVIGDIHGHADQLLALLARLGFAHDGECHVHDSRQVLFLGDFVDRGPQQRQVLETVMAMCRRGSARAIMGNHEFNALAYHTEHPAQPGTWLRPHNNKNTQQHLAFLNEYLGTPGDLAAVLDWFMTLPLWLDLAGGLRLVHACWHEPSRQLLEPLLGPGHTLTPDLLVRASDSCDPVFDAVEILLKGREIALPKGISFQDKDGHHRTDIRIKWWRHGPETYADLALPPYVVERNPKLKHVPLPPGVDTGYPRDAPPVLFGHYWFEGEPESVAANAACLDYSVPRPGGRLVAYRWDGEAELLPQNFVSVGH